MKNLTNRNKIVLAIVGVLVIVVIAVAAFAQVGGGQLFGTTVLLTINPAENPLFLTRGQSLTLSVANGDPTCKWSLPPFLVSLESSRGASISVTGGSVGVGPVNAICNTGVGTKMVAVVPPPPTPTPMPTPLAITIGADTGKSVPIIGYGEWLTLCANDPTVGSGNWTVVSSNPADALNMLGSMYAPGCIVAEGNYHGTGHATFQVTNAQGNTGSVRVDVLDALSISPAYPTMSVGQSITMSMLSADESSTWSIYRGCENLPDASCPVRLSATSGHSVTITAQARGTVLITCKRIPQGGWGDTGLTQLSVQ